MGKLIHKLQNGAHFAEVTEDKGRFVCRTCKVTWLSAHAWGCRCIHIDTVIQRYCEYIGVDVEYADYDAPINIKMGGHDAGDSD